MRWSHKSKEQLITEIRHLKKELAVLENNDKANFFTPKAGFDIAKTVESLNLVGLILEADGNIVFCNTFTEKALGWTAEELVGQNFFDVLVPPSQREQRLDAFKTAMENGGIFGTKERTLLAKNGQTRYIELNSTIFNSAGEDQYLTIIGEDVTERRKVSEALTRSNSQLQDLVNNTSDLVQIISISGRFLYVNKSWQESMGYQSDELTSLKLKDVLHPDFAEDTLHKLERVKNGEKIPDFETVFRRKDGRRLYLSGSVNCRFEKDVPTAFRCIFHNSTAKVRAERATKLYSSIAQTTINSTNLDNLYENIHKELGEVIDVKNFFIAQYDPAKSFLYFPYYIDEYFDSRVHFTKRKLGNGLTEYAIMANQPLILQDVDIQRLAEEKKIYLYGVVPKVMLCVPLRIGDRVTGIIGVKSYERTNKYERKDLELLDFISRQVALAIERKQAEEALARETARLNAIFEGSSHLMWSVNRKMLLTSFNQEYSNLLASQINVRPQLTLSTESMGFRMLSAPDRRILEEKYKQAFKGFQQHFELQLETALGDEKWVEIYLNPILLNNDVIEEVSGIGRDITDLKKYQQDIVKAKDEAERSLKVKERFLANMSHEIRTPMNGVIGMIDLLNDTPLDIEQKDYVQTIKKSSETLLHILNDILDLAKIEAGKMVLHEAPLVFRDLFDRLLALFSQIAANKRNKIVCEFGENLPEFVIADETRLLQILSNLTSNALKFTENGVVRIKINLLEKRGKFNRLKVEVLDSGIGITRENLAILFNAFQQVDNSTTKTFGGTGLGLAISKELCRLMKGEIGVESELGEGSNFWFTVELKQTDISPSMMIRNNDEFHIVDHFKNYQPHLLLVDDNATNRKVASQILIKAGCKVITADSGMKAIELVKSSVNERFDLILMDIQMPEMDGIETTKRLREMEGAGLPPVVAMTAYAMKEDRDRFLSNGMNDYISKPIRAENLVRKVKEWVDKKLSVKTVTSVSDQEKPKSEENLVAEAGSPELFEEILKKLPVLDNEILKQLADSVGGEMDFVVSILEGFEEEALEQIRNAKTGFLENDCRAVQSELHTLKGNSGTLGVMRLHEITRHIEVKAKVCDFRDFEEEIRILESEFEAFQEVYRELAQKVSEK
ncbi:PAS domain S-box-containing protein [Pseudarcicella hirudinis]|uniref:Sensory/regulatory protein RpfC n=1 Tax=Pseudarcicella hirudinis TaxID=1079859 RepID=A0A1I5YIN9_9BACT|nr:PAS domain S-box protein [Pseudarcicella hirudinis]SFQ44069.1 PAS domain S-box-containing protein [Pseudarcicella hirudinis]